MENMENSNNQKNSQAKIRLVYLLGSSYTRKQNLEKQKPTPRLANVDS